MGLERPSYENVECSNKCSSARMWEGLDPKCRSAHVPWETAYIKGRTLPQALTWEAFLWAMSMLFSRGIDLKREQVTLPVLI